MENERAKDESKKDFRFTFPPLRLRVSVVKIIE
jgi:hypothetical protein